MIRFTNYNLTIATIVSLMLIFIDLADMTDSDFTLEFYIIHNFTVGATGTHNLLTEMTVALFLPETNA
jgi:hypothetical protein